MCPSQKTLSTKDNRDTKEADVSPCPNGLWTHDSSFLALGNMRYSAASEVSYRDVNADINCKM
jgi:hypothetical protein